MKQNRNNWDVETMHITEEHSNEWRKEKNARTRAKLFGYLDQPGVIIGEYIAIDHKRLFQIKNEKPDNNN